MKKFIFLITSLLLIYSLAFSQQTKLGGKAKVGGKANIGSPVSGGGINGFTAFKTITIDPAQVVGGSDLSNFPMLFAGTFSYLANTGSGGNVTDSQGDDIVFTSDSGCTTNLKFEQESYSSTTGAVNYWVKIPTLSTASNTLIYLCYGKASITTFQGDSTNVWDSNYKGVWHLKEDPAGGAPQMLDSTVNDNDLTANSGPTQDTNSQINSGISFDGTASLSKTQNVSLNGHSTITIQAWINPTTFGGGNNGRIVDKTQSGSTGFSFSISSTFSNLRFTRPGSNGQWETDTNSISTGVWANVSLTYDYSNTANDPIFYKNGSTVGFSEIVAPSSTTPTDSSNDFYIGDLNTAVRGFNGDMDEVRFSNIIRSADWIATENNNQTSPATFYSVS